MRRKTSKYVPNEIEEVRNDQEAKERAFRKYHNACVPVYLATFNSYNLEIHSDWFSKMLDMN